MSYQICPKCGYMGFIDFVCPMCNESVGDYVHDEKEGE